MYLKPSILLIICIAITAIAPYARAATDSLLIHADLPVLDNERNVVLDVFYASDSAFNGKITIQFYKYEKDEDSILVLKKKSSDIRCRKGLNKIRINFSKDDTDVYCAAKFYQILNRTGSIPPGPYKTIISIERNGQFFSSVYLHEADSMLSPNSPLRKDINKSLLPRSRSFLGIVLSNTAKHATAHAGTALQNARNKTDKAIKRAGMVAKHCEQKGKTYIDLYYQDWYAGRYEVKNKKSIGSQIQQQEDIADTKNLNSITSNNLGSPSIYSQYKALSNERKDRNEMKGELSVNTNAGNGQEQGSDIDNNYYEIHGTLEVPILGIPVQMEGLYTSQDNHRSIKSSYFRIHYNVSEIKEDLLKSVTSYNTKFAESASKGMSMTQIYQGALSKLESQKDRLIREINVASVTKDMHSEQGAAIAKDVISDTAVLAGISDSNVHSSKQEINDKEKRIEEKRKQIAELDKKIEKYKLLLNQYKNTNYFDSSLGYAKTKDVTNNMSYKQIARRGEHILPDGKAKSALAGLTSFDAGMFSKYQSKYTMSGQMMKGVDASYDLGFTEVGATVGKTEYVGRDGSLDKYTCYSGKALFKPAKDQKVGLVYYGYMADRKLLQGDAFFNKANIAVPGFFQPVHIVSANYNAMFTKYVTVDAEVASSFKSSDQKDMPVPKTEDKMAYHFGADGNIPNTSVSLQGTYDKTGKAFENNTLPVSFKGTEQYKLAGRTDVIHALLTVGAEYNYLLQTNFSSTSSNTKWGFDVKTNFKRYPNVAVSYKPFTTFSSYIDTLTVPQRPLVGAVWTGKGSYQFKAKGRTYRFMILYNSSRTVMDTVQTGSTLMQAMIMYSDKLLTGSVSAGRTQLLGTVTPDLTPNNTSFLSIMAGYVLNKKINISAGQDVGVASFGLCKYSFTGGMTYRPVKSRMNFRLNARFGTYKTNQQEPWKQLLSGNMEITYKFKSKIKD